MGTPMAQSWCNMESAHRRGSKYRSSHVSTGEVKCITAQSREHHGQTTTLWIEREGISLADRGAPHRAIPARLVHAGHSSWDEARGCDDVPYFLWDHHPCAHCLTFFWRITHPVAPPSSLPAWQQLISEAVHWLLYALVLATTMTGWIFASERGWSVSLFFAIPLPSLPTEGSLLANSLGKWHGTMEWVLLLTIGVHVAAAMAHTFIFRDQIMQRMLPEKRIAIRTKTLKPEAVTMRPARDACVS
jgi:hypothetical protein